MIIPRLKVEVFKGTNEEDPTEKADPVDITEVITCDSSYGVETTKDTFSFTIPNKLVNGSWTNQVLLKDFTSKYLKEGDDIKIYSWTGDEPANLDNNLIMTGTINSFNYQNSEDSARISVDGTNRTEQLLRSFVLSTFSETGSYNTAPLMIKQLIKRLNKQNYIASKHISVALTSETNPDTGNAGLIQAQKSDSGSFKIISHYKNWEPLINRLEELSKTENTGDNSAGDYIFGIIKSTHTNGSIIDELFWKNKSLSSSGSITRDIAPIMNIEKNIYDVVNALIFYAGDDLRGAGIKGVVMNLDSFGRIGGKWDYYTDKADMFTNLEKEERRLGESFGSVFTVDRYPSAGSYPWDMNVALNRDDNGSPTGGNPQASNDKEYNNYLRDEAHEQVRIIAKEVVEELGEPRYRVKSELQEPSLDHNPGDLYEIQDLSGGWLNTTENPRMKLRLNDVTQNFSSIGWVTTLMFEEDEKTITEALGNT